jgi:hypothetical protein
MSNYKQTLRDAQAALASGDGELARSILSNATGACAVSNRDITEHFTAREVKQLRAAGGQPVTVSEKQKRQVDCPQCEADAGKPCTGRQPGANSLGGGWGGPPPLDSAHAARRKAYLATS